MTKGGKKECRGEENGKQRVKKTKKKMTIRNIKKIKKKTKLKKGENSRKIVYKK